MKRTEKTLDDIVKNNIGNQMKQFNNIYYGREDHCEVKVKDITREMGSSNKFEIAAYSFPAANENTRDKRLMKIGLIQHSVVLPTQKNVNDQRNAIFQKVEKIIDVAALEDVNVLCLPETWSMPFFLCTGEKSKWAEFAEDAQNGPSIQFLSSLARKHKMVIISPILENEKGVWWNTAVVIDETGQYLGKHRKNHLPSVGSFSETAYYEPGNTGHPVFSTSYGKIAVNICYGRHQALNWLMFALNGADIVFNPSATVSEFGESFWGIEARNAAVANHFFTCSINRVGTESFTVNNDGEIKKIVRKYYGSSYITAPNGTRTPGLSTNNDGLLIGLVDLNLCRQVKDTWGFRMTSRLDMYAKELIKIVGSETLQTNNVQFPPR